MGFSICSGVNEKHDLMRTEFNRKWTSEAFRKRQIGVTVKLYVKWIWSLFGWPFRWVFEWRPRSLFQLEIFWLWAKSSWKNITNFNKKKFFFMKPISSKSNYVLFDVTKFTKRKREALTGTKIFWMLLSLYANNFLYS